MLHIVPTTFSKRHHLAGGIVLMGTLLLLLVAAPYHAAALNALTPDGIPVDLRDNIQSYDTAAYPVSQCPSPANKKYDTVPWISQANQPTNDIEIDIPAGSTANVPLQYNALTFLCHVIVGSGAGTYGTTPGLPTDHPPTGAAALTEQADYIESVGVTNTSGAPTVGKITSSPAGTTVHMQHNDNSRYWFGAPQSIVYNPQGKITTTTTIIVTVQLRIWNNFHNGATIACVSGGAPTGNGNSSNGYGCSVSTVSFALQVNVTNQPPQAGLLLSCNGNGTGHVHLVFSDPDGNTTATSTTTGMAVRNYGASGTYDYDTGLQTGNWSSTLVVQDFGGNADRTLVRSSGACYSPPQTGVVGSATPGCQQITGWTYDTGNPNAALQYYMNITNPTPSGGSSGVLGVNGQLNSGQSFYSPDGGTHLDMQPDGNLVLRSAQGGTLWAAGIQGRGGTHVIVQGDGNLVVYKGATNSYTAAVWNSGTAGTGANNTLSVQDDGNMVLRSGATAVWQTQTANEANGPWVANQDLGDGVYPGHEFAVNPASLAGYNLEGSNTIAVIARDSNTSTLVNIDTITVGPCAPVGNVDTASCAVMGGWMFDPRNSSASINYKVYINGAYSTQATANQARGDVDAAFAISGDHGFSFVPGSLPGFNYYGQNTVTVNAVGVDGQQYPISNGTATIGPCPVATTCGSSTFPATMLVNEPQNFIVSPTLSPPPPDGSYENLSVTINGPNGYVQSSPNVHYTPNGTTMQSDNIGFTPTSPGLYTVTWSLTGPVANITCGYGAPAPNNVTNNYGYAGYEPYFREEGGDVSAGAGFGTTNCSQSADITAYNRLQGNDGYLGAGSQLGAILTGSLHGFATATASGGNPSTNLVGGGQPSGLAFANTTATGNSGNNNLGGGVGLSGWCVPDYAAQALSNHPSAITATAPIDLATRGTRNYSVSGNVSLGNSGTNDVAAGVHVTLTVTGDLYIAGNITYDTYTTVQDIPQFNVIVKGNIYIDSSVTELHGFYAAEPNGANTGNVLTCTDASGHIPGYTSATTPPTASVYYPTCSVQLKVYGAVAASKLLLERSRGSLYADAANGVSTDAAEIFQMTPELWLASLGANGPGSNPYQAITSLPPTL